MRDTRYEIGSALILAVVLTSLLAIVGVMFLMVARVDRIATSGISENRELDSAVETVIAKISQELVLDVPGAADPNEEYYNYPDSANRWLASLEPYYVGLADYRWMRISDVYEVPGFDVGLLEWFGAGDWQDSFLDKVEPRNLRARIISPSKPVGGIVDSTGTDSLDFGGPADADGDGVADSRWIKLPNMSSSKGKPIFAAVRIVDNGAMININTAYKFDPNDIRERIDGSSQTQINLMALSWRPGTTPYEPSEETDLLKARANYGFGGVDPFDLDGYERDAVWRYEQPYGPYTPFDISDDLELRSRFLVNHEDIKTRIEKLWTWSFNSPTELNTPVDSGGIELDRWFYRTQHDVPGPNDIYSYRHIGTTYNMDRIINPSGRKMVNINRINPIAEPNIIDLYNAIRMGFAGAEGIAAQMAVNIVDYRDDNNDVSTILVDGATYYGFERPCIYISELVYKEDVNDPNCRSYAVELYKPYFKDNDPCGWRLVIDGNSIPITWSGTKQFHVVLFEGPNAPLTVSPTASIQPMLLPISAVVFDVGDLIELQRFVADVNNYIVVDSVRVPDWLVADERVQSFQRDINRHKCIRRLWDDFATEADFPTLGHSNSYADITRPEMIQAHPANARFTNVGEIGTVFCKSAYPEGFDVIGPFDTEATARIDLANPDFQQIFNYLIVFDPSSDGINNDGDYKGAIENIDENNLNETPEWKIPGRININTAPWYVIAQLPWMRPEIARAIVRDRDIAEGFASIGQLNSVVDPDPNSSIDYYGRPDGAGAGDEMEYPDLTPGDGAPDDFEERDLIFARISNLVTVRSDVFTAYILVRIGADGPQKRVIAILDRSNVYSGSDKVRIVALHPVPDPR